MVKNLPCSVGDVGSIPGQGTKIPCAATKTRCSQGNIWLKSECHSLCGSYTSTSVIGYASNWREAWRACVCKQKQPRSRVYHDLKRLEIIPLTSLPSAWNGLIASKLMKWYKSTRAKTWHDKEGNIWLLEQRRRVIYFLLLCLLSSTTHFKKGKTHCLAPILKLDLGITGGSQPQSPTWVKPALSSGPQAPVKSLPRRVGVLPWALNGREPACPCRRHRFHPWSAKTPQATEQLSQRTPTAEAAL